MSILDKILVVGAGITGATIARLLAEEGRQITVIEKLSKVGGACQDEIKKGAYLQKHGAHIFHTNSEIVYRHLSEFCTWMPYQHKVLGCIDGTLVPIPFNMNSAKQLFPDNALALLDEKLTQENYTLEELSSIDSSTIKTISDFIYKNVFEHYSMKQWGTMPCKSVLNRVKAFRFSKDDRYFQDKYQGIPQCGYSVVIERMFKHKNIKVLLKEDFKTHMAGFKEYKHIFYTGSVDELLDYKYGELPYRTCEFEKHFYEGRYLQREAAVINYPNDYEFTRTFDCSWFMPTCKNGYFVKEYPKDFNSKSKSEMRYYPVNNAESQELYQQYVEEVTKVYPNLTLAGRLGKFKYFNMDAAVNSAIDLVINYVKHDNS